jgi:hypothetical protein
VVPDKAAEARFIELWQQGASYRELAAALGCLLGTVASRPAVLVAQGKIQPRPRGGAYPSLRAKARREEPSPQVQRPAQKIDTGAVQRFDTGAVQRLDRLEDKLQALRYLVQALMDRFDHPPVQTPVHKGRLNGRAARAAAGSARPTGWTVSCQERQDWVRRCLRCAPAFGCRRSPTVPGPSSRPADCRCGRPRLW